MKILYIITKANFGGAQRYVYDLVHSLPRDFEPVVVFGERGLLAEKLKRLSIRTIALASLMRDVSPLADWQAFRELIKLYKNERPDIIHLNSSKVGFMGALAGRIARVPRIIFTAHGWAFNEERGKLAKIGILFLHWLTILLSHKTIAVSEKTKQDMARLPFMKKKITVIRNGIDPIAFKSKEEARYFFAEKNPLLKKIAFENNPIWVGTLSELHKNKGLDLLIGALRQKREFEKINREIICIIVGEGEERAKLEEFIRKNNLRGRVFLMGFIENAASYIKAFDIFTLTSRTEALPYALLEAGQASLAVLASRVGGIPEIVENGQGGLLIEPQSNLIAQGLYELAKHPETLRTYGHNLHQTVMTKFSLDKMLRETAKMYQEIL